MSKMLLNRAANKQTNQSELALSSVQYVCTSNASVSSSAYIYKKGPTAHRADNITCSVHVTIKQA